MFYYKHWYPNYRILSYVNVFSEWGTPLQIGSTWNSIFCYSRPLTKMIFTRVHMAYTYILCDHKRWSYIPVRLVGPAVMCKSGYPHNRRGYHVGWTRHQTSACLKSLEFKAYTSPCYHCMGLLNPLRVCKAALKPNFVFGTSGYLATPTKRVNIFPHLCHSNTPANTFFSRITRHGLLITKPPWKLFYDPHVMQCDAIIKNITNTVSWASA